MRRLSQAIMMVSVNFSSVQKVTFLLLLLLLLLLNESVKTFIYTKMYFKNALEPLGNPDLLDCKDPWALKVIRGTKARRE